MNSKERLNYMDIAKGIGLFAIILGHTNDVFVRFVFPFHVPLFFFVSGFFLNKNKEASIYTKEKIRQLLLPYSMISLVVIAERTLLAVIRGYWKDELFNSILSALYGSGSSYNSTPFSIQPIGAIWFLLALLWALLIVKWGLKIHNFVPVLIILVIFSILSASIIWLPLSLQSGFTAAAYVYIGSMVKNKIKFENVWIAILGLIVYALESYYNISLSIARNQFDAYGLSAIGALLIIYFLIFLCKKIGKVYLIETLFCFLGKNTLPLLGFHLIEITIYPWGHFYGFIDIILIIFFPVLCVLLLRKTKIYKNIFDQKKM